MAGDLVVAITLRAVCLAAFGFGGDNHLPGASSLGLLRFLREQCLVCSPGLLERMIGRARASGAALLLPLIVLACRGGRVGRVRGGDVRAGRRGFAARAARAGGTLARRFFIGCRHRSAPEMRRPFMGANSVRAATGVQARSACVLPMWFRGVGTSSARL